MISACRLSNPDLESHTFAAHLGFVVGVFHHILVQYPRQAELFTAIYFYLAGNIIFCIARVLPDNDPRMVHLIENLGVFNIAYVRSSVVY
jgi:hypothetical protein